MPLQWQLQLQPLANLALAAANAIEKCLQRQPICIKSICYASVCVCDEGGGEGSGRGIVKYTGTCKAFAFTGLGLSVLSLPRPDLALGTKLSFSISNCYLICIDLS